MIEARRVLFLGSGDSARRRVLEGVISYLLGEGWRAFSAPRAPRAHVQQAVIEAAREAQSGHRSHRSKRADDSPQVGFDVVRTISDLTAR